MHPPYVEVSHFRAPYKNSYLGQNDPPPAPPSGASPLAPNGDPTGWTPIVKRDGKYYWNALAVDQIMRALAGYKYTFIGGPTERVSVSPYTQAEREILAAPTAQNAAARQMLESFNAVRWIIERLKEGKVVFAPAWILTPGSNAELAAIPASNKAAVAEAASTPQVAILVEPKRTLLASVLGSPVLLAVGAAALIGAVVVVARRRSRRA